MLPGYTQEEKVSIAVRHLIPKQLSEHGLTPEQLQIPDDSLKTISRAIVVLCFQIIDTNLFVFKCMPYKHSLSNTDMNISMTY